MEQSKVSSLFWVRLHRRQSTIHRYIISVCIKFPRCERLHFTCTFHVCANDLCHTLTWASSCYRWCCCCFFCIFSLFASFIFSLYCLEFCHKYFLIHNRNAIIMFTVEATRDTFIVYVGRHVEIYHSNSVVFLSVQLIFLRMQTNSSTMRSCSSVDNFGICYGQMQWKLNFNENSNQTLFPWI